MSYITVIFAGVAAFLLTMLLGIPVIPYLRKLKFGQTILEVGPSWHKSKEGTPTMGGVMMIIPFVLVSFAALAVDAAAKGSLRAEMKSPLSSTTYFAIIGFAVAMGLIGFFDDYIKVVKKRNLGLTALQKTVLQFVAAAVFLLTLRLGGLTYTWIPFLGDVNVTRGFGLLFWPVALFFVYGFVNAVNLTDGIDGLVSSVTTVVCAVFMLLSLIAHLWGMAVLSVAAAGCCLGFFVWNAHPAKVFMGDTGSLFLGGLVVGISFGTGRPILLMFAGIVYLLEALSVILQVTYYKKTKKRLFKMSPIHHHFELCGWSENRIVLVFSTVALAGGLLALILQTFT